MQCGDNDVMDELVHLGITMILFVIRVADSAADARQARREGGPSC